MRLRCTYTEHASTFAKATGDKKAWTPSAFFANPWLLCLSAILLALTASGAEPDVRRDASVEAVERVMPCVVNIATETIVQIRDPFEEMFSQFFAPTRRQSSQISLGSGVIIDEAGYVLTNDHVIRRASKIWIKTQTNGTPYEATLIASNPRSDVALLKIQGHPGEQFASVRFAQDDDLLLGETVLALGNPFGLGGSVSRGILSSKSRTVPKDSDQLDVENWLQTDASMNPGNSGGPLINLRGELIGLNVAILSQGQGIGFAIPIRLVGEALSGIFTPENSGQSLWFGARVKVGPPPLTITTVQPQSPADKAGLKPGDRITQINGKVPKGFIEFNEELTANPAREDELTVQRDGDRRSVKIKLVPENSFFNADLIQQLLGVRLQEVTPQLANAFGFNSTEGFLVAGVDENVPEAQLLKPGFLISGIDGQTPADLVAAAKLLFAKKKGDKVQLNVVVQRRQGSFVAYQQGSLEIPVR